MVANKAFSTALVTACTVTVLSVSKPLFAQSITAADSGTTVQVDGNQYDINGGSLSGDGANLFHSFEKFGLNQNEIANFVADPAVQNILGRVVGGNASVIDGLLQISGGNANLFLINPAGVLLGPNVSLNLPAAFTVTTANGVGFGDSWFSAFGPNDYAQLVGSPDIFAFTTEQPGAIANLGDLTLNPGERLMLLGGTVINTGSLNTSGGQITIAAISGENIVRISHEGLLLNLELETTDYTSSLSPADNFTPLSLPALLTGSPTLAHASGVTVNPDASISLTGSDLQIPTDSGSAIISGEVDTANLFSPTAIGGSINLLGQTVSLLDAAIDASGSNGGGNLRIGGPQKDGGDLLRADVVYVDENSSLRADALTDGSGGEVIVWSELTSRIYGDISARGGVNSGDGGLVETSSRDYLDVRGAPDTGASSGQGGVWLIDPHDIIIDDSDPPSSGFDPLLSSPFIAQADTSTLSISDLLDALENGDVIISTGSTGSQAGDIFLETDLDYNGVGNRTLELQAAGDILIEADIFDSETGSIPDFPETPVSDDSLTLLLLADIDNSGDGSVVFGDFGSPIDISTQGGDIIAQANTQNNSDAAIVVRENSILDSGDGAILLTGIGGDGPGIEIETGETGIFSNNGAIILNGNSQADSGILINGVVSSFGGNITLMGNSGNGSLGIDIAQSIFSGGGRIELTSDNDIQVEGIFAEIPESTMPGGEIVVTTAGFFRATGNEEAPATISTVNAPITITHGGNGQTPFVVGDADVNGTAVSITNSADTIEPSQSFLTDFVLGDISILTGEPPTTPDPPPVPPTTPDPSPPVPPTTPEPPPPVPSTTPDPPEEVDCLIGCGFDNDAQPPPETEETASSPLAIAPTNAEMIAFQTWQMEDTAFTNEFADYLGLEDIPDKDFADVQGDLLQVASATGISPALIYVVFTPASAEPDAVSLAHPKARDRRRPQITPRNAKENWRSQTPQSQDSDQLELILATPSGPPIRKRIEGVTRAEVQEMANRLSSAVTLARRRRTNRYLKPAQQFYDWLIEPLEAELAEENIQHLSFVMDAGLRSLPISVLHNGQDFIIERYSLGIIPSLNLTDTRYVDIRNAEVLAMGASEFETLPDLPSVPLELNIISQTLWEGREYINESFTPETLVRIRRQFPYGIVHLATHGEFRSGQLNNSYIQFWDQRLQLDQIQQLGLNDPPLELLVLSACRMALGDQQAELGFAGLAVQAGVRTALASLWQVSDLGAAILMTEFYHQLRTTPIKAEALRQAQLAMLKGETTVKNNQLHWTGGELELPPEIAQLAPDSLSHPYFWGAFTLIGSPW